MGKLVAKLIFQKSGQDQNLGAAKRSVINARAGRIFNDVGALDGIVSGTGKGFQTHAGSHVILPIKPAGIDHDALSQVCIQGHGTSVGGLQWLKFIEAFGLILHLAVSTLHQGNL